MFGRLFGRKQATTPDRHLVAELNARLQPMHRGDVFEDPLDAELKREGLGEVSGGGTLLNENGEVAHCDIEIHLATDDADAPARVIEMLQALGAPRGSKLHVERDDTELAFGIAEGLAIYLNGTDLPSDVYRSCDSNLVYRELARLIAPGGRVLSYWEGHTETAFYLYGTSFEAMRRAISDFVASYPLCERARIEQIA